MESSTHYHWSPPGAAVSVKLSFDVLDQILQETMRGFGAVPKRGAEVGGVLLGRFDGGEVIVDGHHSVPCDYKLGPGYNFTDEDWRRLADAVASKATQNGLQPVGLYRSHTGEGFAPDNEDLKRLDGHFPNPSSPLLLIKPFATKISRGAFFFRDNGALPPSSPEEFPFSRKLLGGGSRRKSREADEDVPRRLPAAESAPATPQPHSNSPSITQSRHSAAPSIVPHAPAPAPRSPIARSNRSTWIAGLSLAVALGWAGGFFTARHLPRPPEPQAFAIQLAVSPRGNDLDVVWDPSAAPIRTATRGSIHIKSDVGEKTVGLDLDQLREGRAIVRDATATTVRVDLEVEQIAGSLVRQSAIFTPRAAPQ